MSSAGDAPLTEVDELPVRVIRCRAVDSDLGGMTYVDFADDSGTRLTWRASGKFDIPTGGYVTLSGTVVERRSDGTVKLTRCTVDGQSAGVLADLVNPEPAPRLGSAPEAEPTAPIDGSLGVAWRAVDRGMCAVARVLFVLLGLSVLLPFIGIIIAAIVIPTLIVVTIVLAVRRSRRSGTVQYGNSLVSQSLTWTLISLGIAVVCLVLQIGFLTLLSAITGG